MANTITGLIPTLYQALDVVSREMIGFIPAVTRNSSAERAAVGETITYPVAPPVAAQDITPAVTAPNDGDQTIGTGTMTISKSRYAPVRWNGEEMKTLGNNAMMQVIMRDQFAQAMRALVNEVETDLGALYLGASRAFGTAGTAPFGSAGDLSDVAQMLKILEDNGAPMSDLHLVLGTAAAANLRGKQSALFKVNEAGDGGALLRRGIIGQLEGFDVHVSSKVKAHTAGTGANATTTAAGFAAGATSIALASAGTGTILTGDVVNFAVENANYQYVVVTGDADVSNGGTVVIAAPGLAAAIGTSARAITLKASYTANMAFSRNAIHLVTRAPAMPEGGDAADDVMEIQDPVSGLAFQIAVYRQYRQVRYEVGLAWGVECAKSEHLALLLG